jgi:hypothetical protein
MGANVNEGTAPSLAALPRSPQVVPPLKSERCEELRLRRRTFYDSSNVETCRSGGFTIIRGIPPGGSQRLGTPRVLTPALAFYYASRLPAGYYASRLPAGYYASRLPARVSADCPRCATGEPVSSPPFRSWRRGCRRRASTADAKLSLVAPGPREVAQHRDPTSSRFDIPRQCLEYSAKAAVCRASGRS